MNRFETLALVTAVVATLLGAMGSLGFAYRYYIDQMSAGGLPVAAAGWAIATYGPLAIATLFWRCAKHLPPPLSWVLHICFFPCALVLFNAGDVLMISTIRDPDFDATLDAPEMPALLSLLVAVGGYITALLARRRAALP